MITGRERLRWWSGCALLAAQAAFFAYARFVDTRYFCWAPFHSQARYTIDATIGGRPLDDLEIAQRYALERHYWDPATRTNWELNSIAHVIGAVDALEESLPEQARAQVTITYRVNGREPAQWRRP